MSLLGVPGDLQPSSAPVPGESTAIFRSSSRGIYSHLPLQFQGIYSHLPLWFQGIYSHLPASIGTALM
ncbi:hypothetical protein LEMLEM_LOCUS277 [Lemmus lemmus]